MVVLFHQIVGIIALISNIYAVTHQHYSLFSPLIKQDKSSITVTNTIKLKPFNVPQLSEDFKQKMVAGVYATYEDIPFLERPFAVFDTLIQMRPDRPEGYFLKAALYLYMYQIDNSKANFDSLKHYADKIINICDSLLKKNPNDQYVLFYLGAIYGNMGLQYLKQNNYWNAYWYGVKGKNYLEKTIKIDSTLTDAEFGIGIYLYYADILPKYIKPLLYIVRLAGNKEEGLKKIRFAAENSFLGRMEAYYFLAKILDEYEGRTEEAQSILQKLSMRFPDSQYYIYTLGVFYYEHGEFLEAQNLFQKLMIRPHWYYLRSAMYYLGNTAFTVGNYSEATLYFRELITQFPPGAKDKLREVYYYSGLIYEYQKDRTNAVIHYKIALTIDSKLYSKELNSLLRAPLTAEDLYIKKIEDFINLKKYDQAELLINGKLNAVIQRQEHIDEYNNSRYNILLTAIALKQNKITEAGFFLKRCNDGSIRNNTEWWVRDKLLSFEVYIKSKDNKGVEKSVNELRKVDFNKLPIYYHRIYNNLQYKYFGEVKY
jgi:hypothetical protein